MMLDVQPLDIRHAELKCFQHLYFYPASKKMQKTAVTSFFGRALVSPSTVVVLGTGGTIAGTALGPHDGTGYTAAKIGVAEVIAGLPSIAVATIEAEQVVQIDSKDMDAAAWLVLARAVARHLEREEVAGIVVTHGTDTLEETAYFLQRVLAPAKPVVMTAAMRPATSLQADGPQNLTDALVVACEPGAQGVTAALAGKVHGALDLRKRHTYRLDAFSSGDAGPIAHVEEGRLRRHRDWPSGSAIGLANLPVDAASWPKVDIVFSHAGADGRIVDLLRDAGISGIVVAATGNGTLHRTLQAALIEARRTGIAVLRSTRCAEGAVIDPGEPTLPSAGALTPVQARIELMLRLIAAAPTG